MIYTVELLITNKKNVRDPEGDTIHKHLILRRGYKCVRKVRAGKYFVFEVEANDSEEALRIVREMSFKLRLYNPIVHHIEVRLRG